MADAMTEAAAQGGGAPAALVQIADHPGLTIEELRRRIGLSHSAVVRLLDRLAARDLVRRERGQHDARTAGLQLTEQGRDLAQAVLGARKQVTAAIITRLMPDLQGDLESPLDESRKCSAARRARSAATHHGRSPRCAWSCARPGWRGGETTRRASISEWRAGWSGTAVLAATSVPGGMNRQVRRFEEMNSLTIIFRIQEGRPPRERQQPASPGSQAAAW
jgi:DNA-binding MarR family transcriptional regulator